MTSQKPKEYINDKWLFVFVYPLVPFFIIHVGNDNSFSALLNNSTYYSDLLLGLICTYLAGFYLRAIYTKDESKGLPGKFKSIFLFAFLLPLSMVIGIEALYLELMLDIRLADTSILFLELPLAATVLTILNLIYALIYTKHRHQSISQSVKTLTFHTIESNSHKPEIYKQFFLVNRGATTLNIPITKVAYFIINSKITFLVTDENDKYMYGETIENLRKTVQPEIFFQLNRQIFAKIEAVKGYEQTSTRKLEIRLYPEPTDPVFVSKERAAKFIQWLQAGSSNPHRFESASASTG